jgi:L-lactate dehydrogenase complex protein LldG
VTSARAEILERVRRAAADAVGPPSIPREYRPAGSRLPDLDLFCARLTDYGARVIHGDDIGASVAACCADYGVRRVAVPTELSRRWQVADVEFVRDEPPLAADELDACDAALIACSLAIAETGTIVLDHSGAQGRRALSLVPDVLIIVVDAGQVVADVPDAIAGLDARRPQTWISGPSATSDIELHRVAGVHGPRILDVILTGTQ